MQRRDDATRDARRAEKEAGSDLALADAPAEAGLEQRRRAHTRSCTTMATKPQTMTSTTRCVLAMTALSGRHSR